MNMTNLTSATGHFANRARRLFCTKRMKPANSPKSTASVRSLLPPPGLSFDTLDPGRIRGKSEKTLRPNHGYDMK